MHRPPIWLAILVGMAGLTVYFAVLDDKARIRDMEFDMEWKQFNQNNKERMRDKALLRCANGGQIRIQFNSRDWMDIQCVQKKTNVWKRK